MLAYIESRVDSLCHELCNAVNNIEHRHKCFSPQGHIYSQVCYVSMLGNSSVGLVVYILGVFKHVSFKVCIWLWPSTVFPQ